MDDAYNAETTLARGLDGHYTRAVDETYALIRGTGRLRRHPPQARWLLTRLDPLTAPPAHPGSGHALRPAHRRQRLLSRRRSRPALRGQIHPNPT